MSGPALTGTSVTVPTNPPTRTTPDPTPTGTTASFSKVGHTLPTTAVTFHRSGAFFATGSVDSLVKVPAYCPLPPTPMSGPSSTGTTPHRVDVTVNQDDAWLLADRDALCRANHPTGQDNARPHVNLDDQDDP